MNYNSTNLIGRLTRDPEVYNTENSTITRFNLAVNRKHSKEKTADFINIICWNKLAETAAKLLKKGSEVLVVGEIRTGSYDKGDQKHFTTEVLANMFQLLEKVDIRTKEESKEMVSA